MNVKKTIFSLLTIILLSGCSATYNLEISESGFKENIDIIAGLNETIYEYAIPAYFGTMGYEDVDANFLEKIEGVEYYKSKISDKNNQLKINYNYKFDEENIKKSNILKSSYETVIFKRYDSDDDGKNDYMILSTNDEFMLFNKFSSLESIQVNITCNYEIISSNADEVNKNIHTWYLTRDDIKAINIVYNPDKVVDYRTLWEKILDGDYLNPFTLSILILLVGFIGYKIFKKYSEKRNEI